MKIFKDLSNIKNMVFNVEKMLTNSMELKLWQWGGRSNPSGMSSRYCGFRLLKASFRQRTYQCRYSIYQELLRQHVVVWVQRAHPGGKYSADLALIHKVRTTQQLCAEFWTPADWPPYSPDLNPLDFVRYLAPFAGEIPSDASR